MKIRMAALLRQLRKERGLTQCECAARLGLNHSTISAYENNLRIPPCETLVDIAQFYEVTTDYLLGHQCSNDNIWENLTYSQKQIVKDFANFIFERHICETKNHTKK